MSKAPKLQPCPFCGSKKVDVGGARLPEGVIVCGQMFVFFVSCPVCFTRGPLSADVDTGVTNWNVRAERKK